MAIETGDKMALAEAVAEVRERELQELADQLGLFESEPQTAPARALS